MPVCRAEAGDLAAAVEYYYEPAHMRCSFSNTSTSLVQLAKVCVEVAQLLPSNECGAAAEAAGGVWLLCLFLIGVNLNLKAAEACCNDTEAKVILRR